MLDELRGMLQELSEHPLIADVRPVASLERKGRDRVRRSALARAAEVLCLLEAVAMALCVEAPGLQGVLERVGGGGDFVTSYRRPAIPDFARRLREVAGGTLGG